MRHNLNDILAKIRRRMEELLAQEESGTEAHNVFCDGTDGGVALPDTLEAVFEIAKGEIGSNAAYQDFCKKMGKSIPQFLTFSTRITEEQFALFILLLRLGGDAPDDMYEAEMPAVLKASREAILLNDQGSYRKSYEAIMAGLEAD